MPSEAVLCISTAQPASPIVGVMATSVYPLGFDGVNCTIVLELALIDTVVDNFST